MDREAPVDESSARVWSTRAYARYLLAWDWAYLDAGHAGAAPGGQTHWRLRIVSPAFAGQSTLARHRMVYAALGELMQHPIHALAIRAETPDEAHHSKGTR
jgi:stress-induced morphogen